MSVHFGSETFPKQFRREFWVTFPPFSARVDQHFGLFRLRGACLRIDKVSRVAGRGGDPPHPLRRAGWYLAGLEVKKESLLKLLYEGLESRCQ